MLHPGGIALVAAVSRFASLHDGLRRGWLTDPDFAAIVDGDLTDGQHRNPTEHPHWFTTAFFHHPDELAAEVVESGLELRSLVGVEGAAWLVDDLEPTDALLDRLRRVEAEPTLLGVSAHLLAVASAPERVD